jgi:uroporphyrinogen-III synthase/uroporphyrinogen III methyltransferase/synthase
VSRARRPQERIVSAAAALFGARPPEVVTMEQVARRARVAKGTVYLYFPSKAALLDSLLRSHQQSILDGIAREALRQGSEWSRLRRAIEFLFRAQVDAADWYRVLRRAESGRAGPGGFRARSESIRAALRRLLSAAAPQSGEGDAALVLGAVDAAVQRSVEEGRSRVDAESRALWRFIRRALGAGPLAGAAVLVTREEDGGGPLSAALRSRGARVVNLPLLETLPPEDPGALSAEAARLDSYDWVVLTSARAARALAEAARNGAPTRLAVVGEATAREARARGWEPTVVGRGGAADLAVTLSEAGAKLAGARVLWAAADRARAEGVQALESAGANVRVVTAYRTVTRRDAEVRGTLAGEAVDAVALASPSAAEALAAGIAGTWFTVPVAAIGATTAEAARRLGFTVVVTADRPDFEALAEAVVHALDPGEV